MRRSNVSEGARSTIRGSAVSVTGDKGGPPQVQAVQKGIPSDAGSVLSSVAGAGFCLPAQHDRAAVTGRVCPAQQQVPAARRTELHWHAAEFSPQQELPEAAETDGCRREPVTSFSAPTDGTGASSLVAVVASDRGRPIDATA
jgi:hypothetical protein